MMMIKLQLFASVAASSLLVLIQGQPPLGGPGRDNSQCCDPDNYDPAGIPYATYGGRVCEEVAEGGFIWRPINYNDDDDVTWRNLYTCSGIAESVEHFDDRTEITLLATVQLSSRNDRCDGAVLTLYNDIDEETGNLERASLILGDGQDCGEGPMEISCDPRACCLEDGGCDADDRDEDEEDEDADEDENDEDEDNENNEDEDEDNEDEDQDEDNEDEDNEDEDQDQDEDNEDEEDPEVDEDADADPEEDVDEDAEEEEDNEDEEEEGEDADADEDEDEDEDNEGDQTLDCEGCFDLTAQQQQQEQQQQAQAQSTQSQASDAATTGGGGGGLCFSKDASVQVLQHGSSSIKEVAMKDLKLGDLVNTNKGYQPIYSFGHYDVQTSTNFLRIHTNLSNNKKPLEITNDHMIFLQNQDTPVTAGSIQIGDKLQTAEGIAATVTKINTVHKEGLYAPLTMSGTVVVDGILASSYITLQPKSGAFVHFHGIKTWISQQQYVHILLSPHRILCVGLFPTLGETYTSNGMPIWIDYGIQYIKMAHNNNSQNIFVEALMLLISMSFTIFFYLLELLVGPNHVPLVLATMIYFYYYYKKSKTNNKKEKV